MAGEISGYRLRTGSSLPVRLWSRRLAASSYGNPVVAADGTIYETAGNALYALAADGQLRWKIATPMPIEVSPAVADGGVVVFGSNDRREYGINPNGRIRWRVPIASSGRRLFDINTGSQFDDYPALAPDGTLLIGDQNGTLYAIR